MENCIKLRINAGDKNASNAQDKAIADSYGNKFIIPLDFEMLDSAAPYYQAGLGNRLMLRAHFQLLQPSYQISSIITKSSRCKV